jgi:hypothetical protein
MVPDAAGLSSGHGQEFGPPKTATEKHGSHGAAGA